VKMFVDFMWKRLANYLLSTPGAAIPKKWNGKFMWKSRRVTSFKKSGANSLKANIYCVKVIEIVETNASFI